MAHAQPQTNDAPQDRPLGGRLGDLYRDYRAAHSRFFDQLTQQTYRMTESMLRRKGVTQHDRCQDVAQNVLLSIAQYSRKRPEFLDEIQNWNHVLGRQIVWKAAEFFRQRERIERFEDIPLSVLEEVVGAAPAFRELHQAQGGYAKDDYAATLERFHGEADVDEDTIFVVHERMRGEAYREIAAASGLSVNACTLRYRRYKEQLEEWARQQRAAGSV